MSFVRDPRSGWTTASSSACSTQRRATAAIAEDATSRSRSTGTRTADWSWLSAPADGDGHRSRPRSPCPANTPYGMYDGRDRALAQRRVDGRPGLRRGRGTARAGRRRQHHRRDCGSADRRCRPPSATCSTTTARSSERPTGPGGRSPATGGSSSTTWRRPHRTGTLFLADTTWDDAAPFTDLDTLIFGRSANSYQLSAVGSVRGAVHPRHGRQEPEHQRRGGRVDVRHGHRRRA